MSKFRFTSLLLIITMLIAAPLSAFAAKTFFKNYLVKNIEEVIAAEGEPDEINLI